MFKQEFIRYFHLNYFLLNLKLHTKTLFLIIDYKNLTDHHYLDTNLPYLNSCYFLVFSALIIIPSKFNYS